MSALSQAKYAPYKLQGVKMSVFDDKKWLTEVFADSGSVFGLAITKKLDEVIRVVNKLAGNK
jgi:spermidine synthase